MRRAFLAVIFLAGCYIQTVSADLMVAVASNFQAPMKVLVDDYRSMHDVKINVAYGSSGKLFAQIKQGAPFQLLLSADQAKPDALEKAGWVLPGYRHTYAIGKLVLWSADSDKIDANGTVLTSGKLYRLAMANPRLAPYGRAAEEVKRALGLSEKRGLLWVQGENIAQTFQFVATGNVEAGFVAYSQLLSLPEARKGSSWQVPEQLYTPIRQDMVLLGRGSSELAKDFYRYLTSPGARVIIQRFGYILPEEHRS